MQMLGALVLLGLVWQSNAFFNGGVLYPFALDSLLTCYVPNPFRGKPGEPYTIPEPTPRISLGQAQFNETWLPLESGFRVPNFGTVTKQQLLEFLGDCLNNRVVAVAQPIIDPPTIEQLIAFIPFDTGSGGLFTPLVLPPPYNCTGLFDEFPFDFGTEDARTDAINFVCVQGLRIGLCEIETLWQELPQSFFPRFYAAGRCARDDQCSFPAGEYCFPRVGDQFLLYTPVLRWDCCFTFGPPATPAPVDPRRGRRGLPNRANQLRWECGWRKVYTTKAEAGNLVYASPNWKYRKIKGLADE